VWLGQSRREQEDGSRKGSRFLGRHKDDRNVCHTHLALMSERHVFRVRYKKHEQLAADGLKQQGVTT
jgi:hypothetical protein